MILRWTRRVVLSLAGLYTVVVVAFALSGAPIGYALRAPGALVWNDIFFGPRAAIGRFNGRNAAGVALKEGHTAFANGGRAAVLLQGIYPGIPKCKIPDAETVTDLVYSSGELEADEIQDAYASAYNATILEGHPKAAQENCATNR